MKKKSMIMMVVSLVLVAALAIGATLAYFADTTEVATNTFTVGDIDIDGAEFNPEDPYDSEAPEDPEDGNDGTEYEFDGEEGIGSEFEKRPFMTVKANSVNCYAFMEMTGYDALNEYGFTMDGISSSWKKVTRVDETTGELVFAAVNGGDGIYIYVDESGNPLIVEKDDKDQRLAFLFNSIKLENIEGSVEIDGVNYDNQQEALAAAQANGGSLPQIIITAGAVQSANLTVAEAYGEAKKATGWK